MLDLRQIGEPMVVELLPGRGADGRVAFGELATELRARSEMLFGRNVFPLEQTTVGVKVERVR
jgi:hypothetical protein